MTHDPAPGDDEPRTRPPADEKPPAYTEPPPHGEHPPNDRPPPPSTPPGQQPTYGQLHGYGQVPSYAQPPVTGVPPYNQSGSPYGQSSPYGQAGGGQTSGLAIGSLIAGIVGLLCGFGSIVAVVLGHLALSKIKKTGEGGRGLAIAGLILGYVALVGWLLYLALAVFAGSNGDSTY
ncbi:DUF4190 domain-containing protein [Actinomadura fulvescens]